MPDLPQNNTTTAVVSVGDYYQNSLESIGDRDWVRLDAAEGDSVSVNLMGYGAQALNDPYVRIYDSSGVIVASNDDIGGGQYNSTVTFTAASAGPYYIEAAAYSDYGSGGYQIAVRDGDSSLNSGVLQGLTWGTVQPDNTVSVRFVPNGQSRDIGGLEVTSEGFTGHERAQFMEALARIEAVCGLRFNVTNNNNADFQIVLDNDGEVGSDLLGLFNPPGEAAEGVGVFNGQTWDRYAGGNLEAGGYGFVTLTHEVLHGLGLAHPHDTGGTSTVFTGVSSSTQDYGNGNLNQGIFTTMSYNSGYWTGTNGSAPSRFLAQDYGYEAGPMALDIAVLQELYGTGTGYRTGNSIYRLPDQNQLGTYWEALWDTGGTDEIRYDGYKRATIDLRAATLEDDFGGGGFVSAARGVQGGYTIANGVVIENATGGSNADIIRGNDARNVLNGRAGFDVIAGNDGNDGNDVIYGGNGNDRLNGNKGNDLISGGQHNDIIHGGLGNDRIGGGMGNDTVYGSYGNDTITGSEGRDFLNGNTGADRIFAGDDADRLYGGTGDDYMNGGTGTDRLIGWTGRDYLFGAAQNDFISGGPDGDLLAGGRGADTFYFGTIFHSSAGAANRDTITDFGRYGDADVIDLHTIDNDRTAAGNGDLVFIGRAEFSGAAGEVRYERDGANVVVQINNDNDMASEMEIYLRGVSNLSADDFIL